MKKIVILSGGTGNDALVHGIKSLYPQCDLKVIVNAYDDGKSTGVCRRITNTLGVSDIRKNHYRMYEIVNGKNINECIASFYNERFSMPKGGELDFVLMKLSLWGLSWMNEYAIRFFGNADSRQEFNDFSIANIIYSQMYMDFGYEETNKRMCNLLGIDDFLILNSYANVTIGAKTINGIIEDEAGIVGFDDKDDRIMSVLYNSEEPIILNNKAIECIEAADIVIISTGTFWSSIYPTLEYGQLYKVVNHCKASKFWFINNNEDKDAKGVGSNDFIKVMKNLGLDIDKFHVMINMDAVDLLQEANDAPYIKRYSMGNKNGLHDPKLMSKALFNEYYGIGDSFFGKVIMDFDNTIHSRDVCDHDIVGDNLARISKSNNSIIVSGNDYKTSIMPILQSYFGKEMYAFQNEVWADASSVCYIRGDVVSVVKDNVIDKDAIDGIARLLCDKFGIHVSINSDDTPTCIKIKPLDELQRTLLCEYLNSYGFASIGLNQVKAIKAGRTTVDIVKMSNDKSVVFNERKWGEFETLYIGDELGDYGNDHAIAKLCTKSIQVESIYETNLILKLLWV